MYVTEFELDSFGEGPPLRFLDLGNGLNVALAPSTNAARQLLHVIPGTLFGNARFFSLASSQALAATRRTALRVRTEEGAFRIQRTWNAVAPDAVVTAGDGQAIDSHRWDAHRARVSALEYSEVFTLDIRRLRRLFQDQRRAVRSLQALARELQGEPASPRLQSVRLLKSSTPLPLDEVRTELARLREHLIQTIERDFAETNPLESTTSAQLGNDPLPRMERELREAREAVTLAEREWDQLRAVLLYLPLREQLSALDLELAGLPHRMAAHTGNDDPAALQQLDERIQLVQSEWKEIRAEQATMARQRDELKQFRQSDERMPQWEAALWQEKGLLREDRALQQLATRIEDLEQQIEQNRRDVQSQANSLAATASADANLLERLDQLADRLHDAERERELADHALAKIEAAASSDDSLDYALVDAADGNAERNARQRVAELRDQLESQDDVRRLQKDRELLDQQVRQFYAEQLMPMGTVLLFGIPFALGAAMIIHALMSQTTSVNWQQVLWGFVIAFVTALVKILRDRERDRMLADARHRLARLDEKLAAISEESTIDADAVETELQAAERELQQRSSQRNESSGRKSAERRALEPARRRAHEATSRLRDLSQQWRTLLVDLNLSPSLTPGHAREALAERARRESSSASDSPDPRLEEKLRSMRLEWERRHEALRLQFTPLQQLAHQLDAPLADESIESVAERLKQAVREVKDRQQQHEQLQRSMRRLRQRASEVRTNGQRLSRQRRHLDEAAKRRLERRRVQEKQTDERREQLVASRERLSREIQTLLSRVSLTPDAVLCTLSEEELSARSAAKGKELANLREQVIQRAEAHGRIHGQVEQRERDDRSQVLLAAFDTIRPFADDLQRLHEQVESIIDRTRQDARLTRDESPLDSRYLRTASQYLRQLSAEELPVMAVRGPQRQMICEDRQGRQRDATDLSKSQLIHCYLALWLARLEQYADRGVRFPIILHDPLAMSSWQRKRVVAQALRQAAAKGHQMLLVTSDADNAAVLAEYGVPIADLNHRVAQEA